MKPIQSFEPISQRTVNMIANAIGPTAAMIAGLGEVDVAAGAGVIDKQTKCLWTKKGRRIEVWMSSDGGFGASKSKEADPAYPGGKNAA